MPDFAEPLARLITEFKRLPGIGQKSAQRMAFHLMRASRDDAEHLSQAILDVKDKLGLCEICNNISDSAQCQYCRDPNRDRTVICVVEEAHAIVGIAIGVTIPGPMDHNMRVGLGYLTYHHPMHSRSRPLPP